AELNAGVVWWRDLARRERRRVAIDLRGSLRLRAVDDTAEALAVFLGLPEHLVEGADARHGKQDSGEDWALRRDGAERRNACRVRCEEAWLSRDLGAIRAGGREVDEEIASGRERIGVRKRHARLVDEPDLPSQHRLTERETQHLFPDDAVVRYVGRTDGGLRVSERAFVGIVDDGEPRARRREAGGLAIARWEEFLDGDRRPRRDGRRLGADLEEVGQRLQQRPAVG